MVWYLVKNRDNFTFYLIRPGPDLNLFGTPVPLPAPASLSDILTRSIDKQ